MDQSKVSFFNISGSRIPLTQSQLAMALICVEKQHACSFEHVELVFVDEPGILEINSRFLQRTYVTDIITFSYQDAHDEPLEGTLYMCIPRIREQAAEFNQSFRAEFLRVFIHGLLHIVGFDDSTPDLKSQMHEKEDEIIGIFKNVYTRC